MTTPPATPEVAKPTDPPVRPAEAPTLLPDIRRPAEPPESQANASPAVENSTPEHAAPLKALDNFLGAANWKERLAYCLNPERVRAEMAEYYSSAKDGPQPYTSALFMASSPCPAPNTPCMTSM